MQFLRLNRSSGGSPRVFDRGTISCISSSSRAGQRPQRHALSRANTAARTALTTADVAARLTLDFLLGLMRPRTALRRGSGFLNAHAADR
jgi:hypothetical protein